MFNHGAPLSEQNGNRNKKAEAAIKKASRTRKARYLLDKKDSGKG